MQHTKNSFIVFALFCAAMAHLQAQTVKDIDGNVYHTVAIGSKTWITENLMTTMYNDGTSIPLVTDSASWINLKTSGYCWYFNDKQTYNSPYGTLYNWYTVNTGKLCPTGWHVPTISEWNVWIFYLGGDEIAGGKIKETGTSNWRNPNTGATNETGFTALPGGTRSKGKFNFLGSIGGWWSSSELLVQEAWCEYIRFDGIQVFETTKNKTQGFSVRCVKD